MKKIALISMMLLMTVASFGHKRVSDNAVVVADTIYYAANHMSVANAEQASYYRLLMTQGLWRKQGGCIPGLLYGRNVEGRGWLQICGLRQRPEYYSQW